MQVEFQKEAVTDGMLAAVVVTDGRHVVAPLAIVILNCEAFARAQVLTHGAWVEPMLYADVVHHLGRLAACPLVEWIVEGNRPHMTTFVVHEPDVAIHHSGVVPDRLGLSRRNG